jgi:hypothetical protein
MKQYVLHTMLLLKLPNFEYHIFISGSLPSTNVQFDSGFGFASLGLPNVASLYRSRSSARSSSLPSHFSTSTSSSQLGNAHGPHVPCDPTDAWTLGALGFAKPGTLGATGSVELQSTLGVVSSIEFQGTLGVANSVNFCSFPSRNAYSTQGLTSGEPTKKKNKEENIKKVFKEKWATKFPWAKLVVDFTSKIQMVRCKVCFLVEGKDKILNLKLDGLQKHARKRKALISNP